MYRERTHGVYIQRHDSAVVWQFRDADPEFAMIQSKELEDQLRQLLRTLGAVVIRGDDYIEVRPKGCSKAAFISFLLEDAYLEKPPDFILCIGDDNSDEKSYAAVKRFMRTAALAGQVVSQAGSIGRRGARANTVGAPSFTSAAEQPAGVYFTATVGKKPTVADSYLNMADDVVELLETMSKTAALEHSMSMINFQSEGGGMLGGGGGGGGAQSRGVPALQAISEAGLGTSPGGAKGFARSLSVGSLSTGMAQKRNNSMTFGAYLKNISEPVPDVALGATEEDDEGNPGVWF